jgi:hypothetical protein
MPRRHGYIDEELLEQLLVRLEDAEQALEQLRNDASNVEDDISLIAQELRDMLDDDEPPEPLSRLDIEAAAERRRQIAPVSGHPDRARALPARTGPPFDLRVEAGGVPAFTGEVCPACGTVHGPGGGQ